MHFLVCVDSALTGMHYRYSSIDLLELELNSRSFASRASSRTSKAKYFRGLVWLPLQLATTARYNLGDTDHGS